MLNTILLSLAVATPVALAGSVVAYAEKRILPRWRAVEREVQAAQVMLMRVVDNLRENTDASWSSVRGLADHATALSNLRAMPWVTSAIRVAPGAQNPVPQGFPFVQPPTKSEI